MDNKDRVKFFSKLKIGIRCLHHYQNVNAFKSLPLPPIAPSLKLLPFYQCTCRSCYPQFRGSLGFQSSIMLVTNCLFLSRWLMKFKLLILSLSSFKLLSFNIMFRHIQDDIFHFYEESSFGHKAWLRMQDIVCRDL